MKLKTIRSQNITGRISNICINCNKEFKKVINHFSVIYCSDTCAQEYERKRN